jgi:xanthine dehydrogenase YagT iron-sulfur-binding subunit
MRADLRLVRRLEAHAVDAWPATVTERVDGGWVLRTEVSGATAPDTPALEIADHATPEWLAGWARCEPGRDVEAHAETVFRRLAGRAMFARADDDAAVGIAVGGDGLVGLFCLAVDPARRRSGLASALVRALLAQSRADVAYLQVEERNASAVAMYRRLGSARGIATPTAWRSGDNWRIARVISQGFAAARRGYVNLVPDDRARIEAPVLAEISLRINGTEHGLTVDTRTSLLDLLREQLDLTGAKKGCDHGQCGACTILVDGRRANACLALAVAHDGAEIVTVEGLADGDQLHALQRAFIEHDAFQCGYCTPGQLCSAAGMLEEVRAGWPSAVTVAGGGAVELTDAEIRERMSGNLCRCGAYANIVPAIAEAARQ